MAGGVGVGEDLAALGGFADLGAPNLGEGEVELVVAVEAVDNFCGLTVE